MILIPAITIYLTKENSIFDTGLNLGYTTDNYHGFGARVNFFAVDDLGAYDNFANKSIHGVDHSETASWLGEAFISYNKGNTLVISEDKILNHPF